MHAFPRLTKAGMQSRRLFSVFALLTLCFVAAHSIPSMASEWTGDNKKIATTTKLKASATKINEHKKLTLTVTVAPSKATGSITFYGREAPTKPFVKIAKSSVVAGVAKVSNDIGIPGTIGFKAVYDGSSKYASSTSKVITVISTK